MNWLRELGRRFGMLLHRHQFRTDLEEEMQLHLDLRQLQQAEQGMPLDQAAFAARRRFGKRSDVPRFRRGGRAVAGGDLCAAGFSAERRAGGTFCGSDDVAERAV